MTGKMRIGFVGVGVMGKPMVRNLLQAGYAVTVLDIRPEPVKELVNEGASSAGTPKEVAEASDMVFTSLPTLKACEDIYLGHKGLLEGTSPGKMLIETSTVPPSLVKRLAAEAIKQQVTVNDAMLLGMPWEKGLASGAAAAEKHMMLLVGGAEKEVQRLWPVLEALGRPIHLGPLGSGALTKVIINAIFHTNYVVTCECFAVAAKAGADLKGLCEVLDRGIAKSWISSSFLPQYLSSGTVRAMSTDITYKDSLSMLDAGREVGVPLWIQSCIHNFYEWAENSDLKDKPWPELIKFWENLIGKPIRFT